MKSKYILLVVSLIFIVNIVNAYTISTLSINDDYTNNETISYTVSGTLSDTTGIVDNKIPLTIDSTKDSNSPINFNADVSSSSFTAYFYINFTSSSSGTRNGWPEIIVNASDTVIVQDNNSQSKSDSLIVDSLSPTLGSITSVTPLDTNNYNYYYSQDINVNYSASSDSETYIDHYIVYVVSVADLSSYATDYVIKEVSDDNSSSSITISTDSVSDGNYYIVIDSEDIVGNDCNSDDVIDTNSLVYFDNSTPTVSVFNLNAVLEDDETYYIDSNNFYIGVKFTDLGSGIDTSNPPTKMCVTDPNNTLINLYQDYNSDYNGFYHPINNSQWGDGNLFKISIDVNDNVDNQFSGDFNVQIDATSPTTPAKPSSNDFLSIDVDKNVTIEWQASTDIGGSGIENYEIYRSTSSFTSVSGLTAIGSTTLLTYEDISSKSNNQRYYYGVVAVDCVDNKSNPQTGSIHTGPSLSIEIADGDDYTNNATPSIEVTFSNDVNNIRFSCNDSTYTSWIDVSGTSETYSSFNMASTSNGCSTSDGKKTIYVEAKSEDSPYLISKDSDYIRYDSTAPTAPLNVTLTELTTGGVKITWTASTDDGSGVDLYHIYYSTSETITTSSTYLTTSSTSYTYNPNQNSNYYFKVSALDETGNESSLSSLVSGNVVRIGPTFTIDIIPHNDINGEWYVGYGLATIKLTSDEELLEDPLVKLKLGDDSYITLNSSSEGLLTTLDYNFNKTGSAILSVTGKNKNNEEASDTLNFIVDANIPSFDVNYTIENSNFIFTISNLSLDVFRVQYLLDNKEELCLKENVDSYDCNFDSNIYSDGNYMVSILAYDNSLNIKREEIEIEINNIDELKRDTDILKQKVESSLEDIKNRLKTFEELLVIVDESIVNKLTEAEDKITSANKLYDLNNLASSKNIYNDADILLLEISDLLPKESVVKTSDLTISYDENSTINLVDLTYDLNVSKDTDELYKSGTISVNRKFDIQEIASQKYYSVYIEFKNSGDSEKEITVIEYIPKDFSRTASDLIFNKEVEIISDDPIIKYVFKIPANSSEYLRYKRKTAITDLDVITKFDNIKFSNPIILSGNVDTDKIKIKLPKNYKLLGYVGIAFLIIIIILIVLSVVSIKKKKYKLGEHSTKASINNYLGGDVQESKKVQEKTSDNKIQENSSKEKDTFDSNYEYIINAIKRTKRD